MMGIFDRSMLFKLLMLHSCFIFICALVFGTNEATMDARVLVNAADLGVQKAKQLRMGQGGFDENEYVTRLISKMGGHEIDNEQQAMDWTKVGKIAMKWSRKVPTMDFM